MKKGKTSKKELTKVERFEKTRKDLKLDEGSATSNKRRGQGWTREISGYHSTKPSKKIAAQIKKAKHLNRTAGSARKRTQKRGRR